MAIHVTRETWSDVQRHIDWLEPIVVLSEESRILTGNDGALYRVPKELWYSIVVPNTMLMACDEMRRPARPDARV